MAEITSSAAMPGGISEVRHPIFTLWYLQKNITHDVAPYVTRVSYSDNINNESDTIEVDLDDSDGRWRAAWYPGKGDTLRLAMGYQGEKLLRCGSFAIDEIEISSPPARVTIRAIASSVNLPLRTCSSLGFENSTLAAIAGRIAKKHQLKLVGTLEAINIDRVTQYAETDLAFLRRLASEYGYAVKVVSDQLIFSQLSRLRAQPPVSEFTPRDIARFSVRDSINKVYQSASVKHQQTSSKQLISWQTHGGTRESHPQASDGSATSADSLKINARVSDRATAQIKAAAALASHNERQQSGSLSLTGMPLLTAGKKIDLTDFGQLSGQWLITAARHAFDRNSGYTTELELSRGMATQGATPAGDSSRPLTRYAPDGDSTSVIRKKP